MRARMAILCCAAATTASTAHAAAEDGQLLCGVDMECVSGVCAKPQDAAHRQVIFISPRGQQDHMEFGTYDQVFTVRSEFDIPKHGQNLLTGARIYSWPTEGGGSARLKVQAPAPTSHGDAAASAASDPGEQPFTYDRDVTIDGTKVPAHSSGQCFDPTNVVLGLGFTPGVIHSDENERYFSNPNARLELVAHCKLQATDAGSEITDLDMWLVADAPGTACVLDMSSDGLLCFDMRETKSGKLFQSTFDGTRLLVRPDGTATYKDVESGSDGTASKTTRYSGTCKKGPAFQ